MEILKGTVSTVKFHLPTSDTTVSTATYSLNGATAANLTVTTANGIASAKLPYLDSEGDLSVTWNFTVPGSGTHSTTHEHEVVTPILELHEIKKIIESDDEEELLAAEAAVRHIIAAHCGQTFGKFIGVKEVSGSGDFNMRLPMRLVSLNSINGNTFWSNVYSIRGGGWFIASKYLGPPSIKADWDGWHYEPNAGVISAPHSRPYNTMFLKNLEYEIDGVWGWERVPERVREAAKLLINDYACGDSIYRDRFLTSMTAADWRIQFHEGAFSDTGNVRANQLLAEYVLRRGWVVV